VNRTENAIKQRGLLLMSPHSFLPVGSTFTVDEDAQALPPSTNPESKNDATTRNNPYHLRWRDG
jgi:hypothetical protein